MINGMQNEFDIKTDRDDDDKFRYPYGECECGEPACYKSELCEDCGDDPEFEMYKRKMP